MTEMTDAMRRCMHRPPALRKPGTAAPALPASEPADYDHHPDRKIPDAKPQRDEAPTLGRAAQGEAEGATRTVVRFIGYRVRPLDPDNFAGSVKDLLDGLRHASLIEGDEPWRIILETEQVKVATFKEERTEITIVTPTTTPRATADKL